MARYLKSTCKVSRRIGLDLNLKGIGRRNITSKCKLKVFPGQHGNKKKKNSSNYSLQLLAKQTVKYTYGILEKQFVNFFKKSSKIKGQKGENLLKLLESRVDNVVYRMGFAITRAEARQLVVHKSVTISRKNKEKIINTPSFIIKSKDIIKIKKQSKNQLRIQHALMCAEKKGFPSWIDIDIQNMSGVFLRLPERSELPNEFNEQLVIEFYSK